MSFLRDNQMNLLLLLMAVVIVQSVFIFGMRAQLSRQGRMLRRLFAGPDGADLQAMLQNTLDESRRAATQAEQLNARCESLEGMLQSCVRHVGMVRYDAFDDASGAQSFSAALLDGKGNGVIITGLLARHESRCYGKVVLDGQAQQMLSEEEAAVLDMARHDALPSTTDDEAAARRERNSRGSHGQ